MRFDPRPIEHWMSRKERWHRWFAWYPIRLGDDDCRWLEVVERRFDYRYAVMGLIHVEYRPVTPHSPPAPQAPPHS